MSYIKVDHSKFESTALDIDNYVSMMKKKMQIAQNEVTSLSSSWQGTDFVQFRKNFDEVDNKSSVHVQMVKALESFSGYLRYAAKKYKEAQNRAINRANGLPRW